ncbi:MAG TPA: thioredoxin [Verrucomicrobiae bacterium]|nr:thioredoxin [Verrucomicrobiae bacterium]
MKTRFELDERGIILSCTQCGSRNRLAYDRLNQTFRCGRCQTQLGPPNEPLNVESAAQFDALTQSSSLPVLVDFWADWCGPCKMVAPELQKVASQNAGEFIVAKVNTELLSQVAQRFSINSIPTLILFRHGRDVTRQSGAMPAAAIRHFVHQHSGDVHA